VRAFWKRDSEFAELEGELRARRSKAPTAFVRAQARRIGGEERWLRPRARVGLAAGLAVLALAAVASAGGFSAARSTTHDAIQVLTGLTSASSALPAADLSPATTQYVINCGAPPKKACEVETFDVKLKEGTGGACTAFVFRVVLKNGPTDFPVTVQYQTEDDTAVAPADYASASGTVTWAPGESGTKTVTVCVNPDNVKEKDEQFKFRLTAVSPNTKIVGKNPVLGIIQNDD